MLLAPVSLVQKPGKPAARALGESVRQLEFRACWEAEEKLVVRDLGR
jgi:hypothetical protein